MDFALSANNFISLSSHLRQDDFVYFNTDRQMNDGYSTITIDGISYRQYGILNKVVDASFNNDTLSILTSSISVSSVLSNLKSISSVFIGSSGNMLFNKYYNDLYNTDKTPNLSLQESTKIKNNVLLAVPYKQSSKYNFIPLKSSQGVDYEYNYNDAKNCRVTREYDAIYFGNNQEGGYDNIFTQYKTETFPIKIKQDSYNVIHVPDKIDTFAISSANLHNFGAIWGNRPCNSDIILFDRFGYNDYGDFGASSLQYNGVPLCLWLSGNSTRPTSGVVWMERWYDPNLVTQGEAFLSEVNTTSALNPVIDKETTLSVLPKSKLTYLRFGNERNKTFVKSFSGNLQIHFDQWSNVIEDNINEVKGFSIPSISTDITTEAKFDGSHHFHIPPTDDIIITSNITVGMWVYQDQWNCGIDTQFFGNFSNGEGYGLFFNTGADSKLLTFPTTSGFVYGFNNKGYRIFEKSINESLGVSASKIDYITTDLYGSRWLYDSINKKIYKLDTDDLLQEVIHLPTTSNINKMQVDSQNNLYVIDARAKRLSGFDASGELFWGPYGTANNNFEITQNDAVTLDFADLLVLDTHSNKIKALGTNLYKNNVLFYHIGAKVQALNIDMDNNIWVAYKSNRLLKISSDGFKLFDIALDLPFSDETSIEIDFIKENYKNCDTDILWMIFNTNNYILKIDSNGNILKRINIKDVVNLKNCRDFYLNVIGDFTGFSSKRKFNKFETNNFIKSNNPAITLQINLNCGTNKKTVRLNARANNLSGWNHIAFSHKIVNDTTYLKLFINGHEKASYSVSGKYFIDYGTKVSPFIMGGRSGKLGATNVEVGLNKENYFKGKINDLRIYNKPLDSFELRGLSENIYFDNWDDMTWYIPTIRRTYMEEIQGFHLNQYHGSKSNKFNIKIKNLDVSDKDTQAIIETAIRASIKKFIPIHTELNEIIFE